MIQITFNNKTNIDIGIVVESISIQPPGKKKIKVEIPYMNGTYDFSTIATNGEPVYSERIINIKFNFIEKTRESLYVKYSKALEWLSEAARSQLLFDFMPDFYFIAEVENAPSFEEVIRRAGKLDVEFIAQPFKIGVDLEGNKIWDTFNFETDVLQDVEFDIVESSVVNIINVGRPTAPMINTNAPMSLIFNSKTYNLAPGDNKLYGFKFQNGENSITINGTGHIKFLFRKQVI